jgi:hypothetical protein
MIPIKDLNATNCRIDKVCTILNYFMINEMYRADNADISMVLSNFVKENRGYWTRYELISQLVDDILVRIQEFQYKWGFLSEFNKVKFRLRS